MPSFVPPKRATTLTFWVALISQASRPQFQSTPTLVAGDVQISKDGGTLANLATLPVVTPASSKLVKVDLSVAEMTADNAKVLFSDVAGAEWDDLLIPIQTAVRQIDDLAFPSVPGRSFVVEADGMIHADLKEINGNAAAAIRLALAAGTIVIGTVDSTAFTPTTTQFEADDIVVAGADHFNGRKIIFTDPSLQDQATEITDYSLEGGRGHFTVVALNAAPADNDTFVIV